MSVQARCRVLCLPGICANVVNTGDPCIHSDMSDCMRLPPFKHGSRCLADTSTHTTGGRGSRLKRILGVLIGTVTLTLVAFAPSAYASSFYTGGSTGSIWNFTTGSTSYVESHNGDDLAFDVTSGIAIDMRWSRCAGGAIGPIQYNITAPGAYRVLDTNFLATTCVHLQFRGYTQTGSFHGYTYWNYNFA